MKHKICSLGNLLIIFLITALWISVFFIHGIAGAISWGIIKLFMPFIGMAGIVIYVIILFNSIVRKRSIALSLIGLCLSIAMTLPILLTMNIVQVAYPISLKEAFPEVTVSWPLKEEAIIGWGGNTTKTNLPHITWASERWAYDIVMEPYSTGETSFEKYGIWNKEVIAPASGIIVEAYDMEDDILPNTEEFKSAEGNHVYIKMEETGTYLLLNHFKKGSITVKTGDYVKKGETIGYVGNSGSTSEPHLHIHHQRQNPTKMLMPVFAEGLPLYFEDINGERMPVKGTVVKPPTK